MRRAGHHRRVVQQPTVPGILRLARPRHQRQGQRPGRRRCRTPGRPRRSAPPRAPRRPAPHRPAAHRPAGRPARARSRCARPAGSASAAGHAGLLVDQQMRLGHAAATLLRASSRSSNFFTLPLAVCGNVSTNADVARHLVPAEAGAGSARVVAASVSSAPARSTTKANASSPNSASGTPTTCASSTVGWQHQQILDLGRVEVLAAPDHHVLGAADDAQRSRPRPASPGRRCAANPRRRSPRRCAPAMSK